VTCNGCHNHGNQFLTAMPNKSSYAPGEEVVITLSGGTQTGWVRGMLDDMNGTEVDRKTGPTLMGNDGGPMIEFPVELKGRAPGNSGAHVWTAKYFGNANGAGHSAIDVPVTIHVGSTSDIVADVIPSTSPLFFPASGGTINCTVELENTTAASVTFHAAVYVRMPSGMNFGPIVGWVPVTLPGGAVISPPLTVNLPGGAPTGVYSFIVYVADFSTMTLIDADSFDFIKQP